MKYATDETGAFKRAENGNPIMTGDDGKEFELDAIGLHGKVGELNSESAGRRIELKAATDKLKAFEGLDAAAARDAIEKLAKIDQKALIDAGKVDEVRQQMKDEYEKIIKEKDGLIEKKDASIYDLRVTSQFAASEWFNGATPKTVLTPALAKAYWGANFKVENGEIVPYGTDGKPILSKADPSKYAAFDEAIEHLVMSNPDKDRFLRSNGGGSGSKGGAAGEAKVRTFAEYKALPVKEKAALAAKHGSKWVQELPKE